MFVEEVWQDADRLFELLLGLCGPALSSVEFGEARQRLHVGDLVNAGRGVASGQGVLDLDRAVVAGGGLLDLLRQLLYRGHSTQSHAKQGLRLQDRRRLAEQFFAQGDRPFQTLDSLFV